MHETALPGSRAARARGGPRALATTAALLLTGLLAPPIHADPVTEKTATAAPDAVDYTADGRLPLAAIQLRLIITQRFHKGY